MRKLCFFNMICLFFITSAALAGQSGYILNGKVVITHKDGQALPVEAAPEATVQKGKRGPASASKVSGILFFDEDDLARCYWLTNQANLHCIKK